MTEVAGFREVVMKVVVVAKAAPRGAKSSTLVNYIAKSKIKAGSERLGENGKERLLFGKNGFFADKEETERFLSGNNPKGNSPLSQIVISFVAEELKEIEENVETQDELLREAVREAVEEAVNALEKKLGKKVGDFRWAAAIHRNTDNPHVHLVISRYLITEDGEPVLLKHIPREWLPHNREAEQYDDEKVLHADQARLTESSEKVTRQTQEQTRELVIGILAAKIIAACQKYIEQKQHSLLPTPTKPERLSAAAIANNIAYQKLTPVRSDVTAAEEKVVEALNAKDVKEEVLEETPEKHAQTIPTTETYFAAVHAPNLPNHPNYMASPTREIVNPQQNQPDQRHQPTREWAALRETPEEMLEASPQVPQQAETLELVAAATTAAVAINPPNTLNPSENYPEKRLERAEEMFAKRTATRKGLLSALFESDADSANNSLSKETAFGNAPYNRVIKAAEKNAHMKMTPPTQHKQEHSARIIMRYLRALYRGDRAKAFAYAQQLPNKTLGDIHRRLAEKLQNCGVRLASTLYQREAAFHETVFNFKPTENSYNLVELRDAEIERRAAVGERYDHLLHPTKWLAALAATDPNKTALYRPALQRVQQINDSCQRKREAVLKSLPVHAKSALLSAEIVAACAPNPQTAKAIAEKIIKRNILSSEQKIVSQVVKRHLTDQEMSDIKAFFATLNETAQHLRISTADKDSKTALLLKLHVKERRLAERIQNAECPYLFRTIRLANGNEVMIAKLIHKEKENSALKRMVAAHLLKHKTYDQSRMENIAELKKDLESTWRVKLSNLFEINNDSHRNIPLKMLYQIEHALLNQTLPTEQATALAECYFHATTNWIEVLRNKAQTCLSRAEMLKNVAEKKSAQQLKTTVAQPQPHVSRTEMLKNVAEKKSAPQLKNNVAQPQPHAIEKVLCKIDRLQRKANSYNALADQLNSRAHLLAASFQLNQLRFYDSICKQLVNRPLQPVVANGNLINLKDFKAANRPLRSTQASNKDLSPAKPTTKNLFAAFTPLHGLLSKISSALKSFNVFRSVIAQNSKPHREFLLNHVHSVHDRLKRQTEEKLESNKLLSAIATRCGFQPNPEIMRTPSSRYTYKTLKCLDGLVSSAYAAVRYNHVLVKLFPEQSKLACNSYQLLATPLKPNPFDPAEENLNRSAVPTMEMPQHKRSCQTPLAPERTRVR